MTMQKHVLAALMLLTCTTNAGYRECATFTYNAPNGGGKVNYKLDCHGCEGNWKEYKGVGTALNGGRQWTYVYVKPGATLYFLEKRGATIISFRDFSASPYPYMRKDDSTQWYPRLKDVRCFYEKREYEFVQVATFYEHHNFQGKKRAVYNSCQKNSNDYCTKWHGLTSWWRDHASSVKVNSGWTCKLRGQSWVPTFCSAFGQQTLNGYKGWNFSTGVNGLNDNFCDVQCYRTNGSFWGRRMEARGAEQSRRGLEARGAQQSRRGLEARGAEQSRRGLEARGDQQSRRGLEARGAEQSRRGLEARGAQQSRRGLEDGQQAPDFTDLEAHWPEEASHHDNVPSLEQEGGVTGDMTGAAHDMVDVFGQGAGDVPPAGDNAVSDQDDKLVGGDLTGAQADMDMAVDDMPTVIELTFSDDWTGEREWTVDGVEVREKKPVPAEETEQEDPTVDSQASEALRRLETLEGGKWQTGLKSKCGGIGITLQEDFGGEEQAKVACAAACDANDLCFYADLFAGSTWQTCYLKGNVCGDMENPHKHHLYRMYTKDVVPVPAPTPAPVPASPTPAPVPAPTPTPEPLGEWKADVSCGWGSLSTFFHEEYKETEEQAKAECAAACDANDLCAYANLYWIWTGTSTCYLKTDQCVGETPHIAYNMYFKGGIPEPTMDTDAPTDVPTPAPTNMSTSASTDSEACEDLDVRTNMLVSIKKGKKQKKTMKLEDDGKDPVCECAELCENDGYDIFQYYSKVKRGKAKTSCQCMNMSNKVKAKTKKGYTAGALTSAAKDEFSKFKVKISKKDQKAGQ